MSKLLAAKRPHLVPIYGQLRRRCAAAKTQRRRWQWWGPWRDVLLGHEADAIDDALRHIRHEVRAVRPELPIDDVSDLRLIDIVVWMATDRHRAVR